MQKEPHKTLNEASSAQRVRDEEREAEAEEWAEALLPEPDADEEYEAERQQWLAASAAGLAAAYGEDEPEYPLSMIREPNPDYAE